MPGLIWRNLGSTALHLGLVASGALTAAFCKRAKIWDVAAGVLLVTESGGRITDLSGADLAPFDLTDPPDRDLPFLAAAPKTHERLLRTIRTALE
jgi:fructose-1,6-bisphosphatase/inositol monophosphatase family enzyme